ncbi:hypothetical protein ACERIT_04995 [Halopenitus sp. H-Gu1]|uniref:hypothetical protein n=1 Tax=Halopenitus sp. H-Gu1 TaxID=3242697 RepID=UPI00359EC800
MQRNILILLVALSVALGATAVTAADHATVEVDQEPDEPATVTVTNGNDDPVENASLTVERANDDQPAYNGTGNYTTDTNGTVELPAPAETVDVVVTATVDNETVSTNATLEALPELDLSVEQSPGQPATVTVTADGDPVENATVDAETVDDNATYAGANETYTTDENGTAQLPVPEETVDISVTATESNRTVSTTTTLVAPPELAIDIEQETGHPATVTVTADEEPLENGTVDVETVDENATYEGTGEQTTDENGTVQLPVPNETVDVIVSVEYQGASASASETLEAPPELEVGVTQDRGHPATVTVTADDEDAVNATVVVEVNDENATYVGANETYTTDENGTVQLPAPNETVAVTVTAELDGASATTDAVLEAAPDLDVSVDQDGPGLPATVTVLADDEAAENASVDVDLAETENASYAGTGEYTTDENGTVELPAPEETVNVSLTVTYQGAKETIMATIEGVDAIDEGLPFGQQLQQFKATLDEDADTGREIASWVVDNNPGNAPDHAGPKNATGDEGAGPPAHANGNDDAESDDETETDDDTESDGDVGTNDDTESDDAGSSGNGGGNGNAGGNSGNSGGNGNAGSNNGNGGGNGNAGGNNGNGGGN